MEDPRLKAALEGHVVAESDDIVECHGYQYFPRAAVRMAWLQKAPKTESDLDGARHERAAWSYEAPRPAMQQVAGRFGFWEDVEVG